MRQKPRVLRSPVGLLILQLAVNPNELPSICMCVISLQCLCLLNLPTEICAPKKLLLKHDVKFFLYVLLYNTLNLSDFLKCSLNITTSSFMSPQHLLCQKMLYYQMLRIVSSFFFLQSTML